jgi:hypothetical protein
VRDQVNYRKSDRWRSYRFYRALQRLKIANALHLREFRRPAIFEFFNTIGAKRPLMRQTGRADFRHPAFRQTRVEINCRTIPDSACDCLLEWAEPIRSLAAAYRLELSLLRVAQHCIEIVKGLADKASL